MGQHSPRNTSGAGLDADLERRVEELARVSGMAPVDVIREALEQYEARRKNGTAPPDGETLYDRAQRADLIGCVKGAPAGLSTNSKYMEGFGGE